MNEDFNVRPWTKRTERLEVAAAPVQQFADDNTQEAVLNSIDFNNGSARLPSLNSYPNDPLDSSEQPPVTPEPPHQNRFGRWWAGLLAAIKLHPRRSLAIGFGVLLLATGGVAYGLAVSHRKPAAKPKVTASAPKPAAPVVITSPLTGIPVTAEQSKHIVTGAMIENTVFARPQSGLSDAGVVFEAIAEAGITRFLALYQETQPANLGPIRSARPYYVDWAHTFDAPLAHVGGSPDALAKIKSDGVKDLDQFYNSGAYHRIGSREAPHNMYTNLPALNNLEASKGWTSSSFTGFARKPDQPMATPAAKTIDIAISGPTYNVHYDYEGVGHTYLRSEGGAAHKDAEGGNQLHPKVVIGLVAPYSLMSDGYHSMYQITGSGEMTVFQDGNVTKGTWTKADATSQYQFSDAAGHPLKLDAGQTWITIVSNASAITYAP